MDGHAKKHLKQGVGMQRYMTYPYSFIALDKHMNTCPPSIVSSAALPALEMSTTGGGE